MVATSELATRSSSGKGRTGSGNWSVTTLSEPRSFHCGLFFLVGLALPDHLPAKGGKHFTHTIYRRTIADCFLASVFAHSPALLAFASRCCERTTRTSSLAGHDPARSSEPVVPAGTNTLFSSLHASVPFRGLTLKRRKRGKRSQRCRLRFDEMAQLLPDLCCQPGRCRGRTIHRRVQEIGDQGVQPRVGACQDGRRGRETRCTRFVLSSVPPFPPLGLERRRLFCRRSSDLSALFQLTSCRPFRPSRPRLPRRSRQERSRKPSCESALLLLIRRQLMHGH
jgi:hypothetical protein